MYESENFYALADRLGIMLWHDFMFACALYPTDAAFLKNVQNEVTHQVRRMRGAVALRPCCVRCSGCGLRREAPRACTMRPPSTRPKDPLCPEHS